MRWLCIHLDAYGFPCNHETSAPLTVCGAHAEESAPEDATRPCEGPRCERPGRATQGGRWLCFGHYAQQKRKGRLGVLQPYHRAVLPPRKEAA